jgi:hypothetical protein
MAKPTKKSKAIEGVIDLLIGGQPGDNTRPKTIKSDRCIGAPLGCGGNASAFRDEISRREYAITGFCQSCQDNMFGV